MGCKRGKIPDGVSQPKEKDFDHVGGLETQIEALKELAIMPLLYPGLYEANGLDAPRGVLFYGPPGTGKTLLAGALVGECKKVGHKISFFKRKGADCLNKYLGESEKNLRDLFTAAECVKPSIIFFDELDGLAAPRTDSEDGHLHSSVVGTLLALLDGLDSKSGVFVIGATNRIDLIDPALRRSGRFDSELFFPLPSLDDRVRILNVHTSKWKIRPTQSLLVKLANTCVGFCGADLKALCGNAIVRCFYRENPQVKDTRQTCDVDLKNLKVSEQDLWSALHQVVPSGTRSLRTNSTPIPHNLQPLLKENLKSCMNLLRPACPYKFLFRKDTSSLVERKDQLCPRWLLLGSGDLAMYLAPAVFHNFDHLPVTTVDLAVMSSEDEAAALLQKLQEARQAVPGILYLADITKWWESISSSTQQLLLNELRHIDSTPSCLLFIFGTADTAYYDLPCELRQVFPQTRTFQMHRPGSKEIKEYFSQLIPLALVPPRGSNSNNRGLKIGPSRRGRKPRLSPEVCQSLTLKQSRRGCKASSSGLKTEPGCGSSKANKDVKKSETRQEDSKPGPSVPSTNPSETLLKRHLQDNNSESEIPQKKQKDDHVPASSPTSVAIDEKRLNNVLKKAVQLVADSNLFTMLKLYEEAKAIIIHYSNFWDRVALTQKLETLLMNFCPHDGSCIV